MWFFQPIRRRKEGGFSEMVTWYSVFVAVVTYVGEDAVALFADAALQTEGQVVAADHDSPAEAFLKGLHVQLDAREVQPLEGRGEDRDRKKKRWEIRRHHQ